MPIPSREFEATMLPRGQLPGECPRKANGEEDRSNDDVKSVEPRRHKKGRAVDRTFEREWRVNIFVGLNRSEGGAKQYGQRQPCLKAEAVAVEKGVMCPGHRRAR